MGKKEDICKLVRENPGISTDEIAKRMQMGKFDVLLILAELEDEKKIRIV